MSAVLYALEDNEQRKVLAFHCPGCRCDHGIPVQGDSTPYTPSGFLWQWNDDMERPTFTPSLNYTTPGSRCHSFVKDGQIQFLTDCDHALRGTTVPIPEVDP